MKVFPTDYDSIVARLHAINPIRYAQTRNDIDGLVTCLSPYLTHGVITLPEVQRVAHDKVGKKASYKLVFELAWREYYKRVWWERGDGIFIDIKRPQDPVRQCIGIPTAFLHAQTGIDAIDASLSELYETGYVHNHARMWTAMLGTNVAQVGWKPLARWYYYHLLDGDLASNTLSWQWVAGTFSSKKYIANQDSINRFDSANWQNSTYLSNSYEDLLGNGIPEVLKNLEIPNLDCILPKTVPVVFTDSPSVLLYHSWSLNPKWHEEDFAAIRVLILEPSHFAAYPMGKKRIDFILALAKNISALQIFIGEVQDLLPYIEGKNITSVAHPATRHFPGMQEEPEWLFQNWNKAKPIPGSFMGFWNEVEKELGAPNN
jgi:deoxyribodipyrimidine photo-lyase